MKLIFSFLLSLSLGVVSINTVADEMLSISDLREEAGKIANSGQVLMIEFASDSCGYCRKLEAEFLNPMQLNSDYDSKVLIRSISIDEGYQLIDFQGELVDSAEFAAIYDVSVTPTLVFLDSKGRQLSPQLVGLWSLDYFGAYIDERIEAAREKL
ncbi:MAG: thioredoxin-related protein [Planctomycetota bacterium]|jgi:thioredoxin-related protein